MTTTAKGKVKRHPIRGAIFGLLLGIGTAALLIMYAVIALGTLPPLFVIAGGVIVGVLWGMYGPVKTTRELPPSRLRTMPEAKTPPGQTAPEVDTGKGETGAEAEAVDGAEAADGQGPNPQGTEGNPT